MVIEELPGCVFVGGPLAGRCADSHSGAQFVRGPFAGRYERVSVAYLGEERSLVRTEYAYDPNWVAAD